jgi:hypothetical protein
MNLNPDILWWTFALGAGSTLRSAHVNTFYLPIYHEFLWRSHVAALVTKARE